MLWGLALALPQLAWAQVPEDLERMTKAVRDQPLPIRMTLISDLLLGKPYLRDPEGEGVVPDPDPIGRYDTFDCQTFVEGVLALSLADDPDEAVDVLRAIRYRGDDMAYDSRRHFIALQWMPDLVANGLFVDTTRRYGETVHTGHRVTEGTWRAWQGRARFGNIPDEQLPVGEIDLNVLPVDTAISAAQSIAPGTIVLTVRTDRPWLPYIVTHVGFVIEGERRTLRHASPTTNQVLDVDLETWLGGLHRFENWPALGVVLLEPVDPATR